MASLKVFVPVDAESQLWLGNTLYKLMSKGIHMPLDRLIKTVRTIFRGNSEYAFTQSGNTVRLRSADGDLTARGREMYTEAEITVEVPAIQIGTNKLNERYRIQTYKVFTENEFP